VLTGLSRRGFSCRLIGANETITAVTDAETSFEMTRDPPKSPNRAMSVSVFAAGEKAVGVTLSGLKYTLENATLTNTTSLGLSNEFISGEPARIAVQDGTLLVVTSTQQKT
jgi:thiamine pyrophosphokinase